MVDIQLIGHSRGSVVITQAMQDLQNDLNNIPQAAGGYWLLTYLDPHLSHAQRRRIRRRQTTGRQDSILSWQLLEADSPLEDQLWAWRSNVVHFMLTTDYCERTGRVIRERRQLMRTASQRGRLEEADTTKLGQRTCTQNPSRAV